MLNETVEAPMSVWLLILLASAGGGALLVWHNVSHTKHASEIMLRKYDEMLAEARARRNRPAAPNQASDEPPSAESTTGVAETPTAQQAED